jgi:hypothetical protein
MPDANGIRICIGHAEMTFRFSDGTKLPRQAILRLLQLKYLIPAMTGCSVMTRLRPY